ncbi:MAG: ChbG/HpnK family deacetylase [Arenicellales bacterium]
MKPTFLIVNADDFGYFEGVSRGIAEAARSGIVTATGVIANAANVESHVRWLDGLADLDTGVHLNLTEGEPLSEAMRVQLRRWNGRFPRKLALVSGVLRGVIGLRAVAHEWHAQIERCRSMGLKPRFLNSHEHVHMLPSLFRVASALADEFHIPHIRVVRAEWRGRQSAGSIFRNLALGALGLAGRARRGARRTPAPVMLGLAESGNLSGRYLSGRLAALREGGVYELMCHPGILDRSEAIEPRIMAYHHWDAEREALCSDAVRELLQRREIRLIGYRHLGITDGALDTCGLDQRA